MTDRADGFTDDTCELAQCAQINFNNCERMIPGLKTNLIWILAMEQFDAVVDRMERDTL